MNRRSLLAAVATGVLLLLTLGTAALIEHDAPAWVLAGNACLKVAVIGWVFLELDRAWPLWGLLVAGGTLAVAAGAVVLMGA